MSEFDTIYQQLCAMLDEGVTRAKHPYHLMAVACVNERGGPEVRTVVLRRHDTAMRTLAFHTDIRSPKVAWIRARPDVSLLFYDTHTKIQLRVYARAQLHHDDEVSARQWAATKQGSKSCYMADSGSGTPVDNPDACGVNGAVIRVETPAQDEAAYQNFAVISCVYSSIDYVHLAAQGHRRALLTWQDNAPLAGHWVAV